MSLIDIVVEPYGPLWRVMEKRGPAFSYVLASHNDEESAESHARRIRAALDWRPADGDPQVAHTAAQDERIARLEAENAELRERAVVLGEPLRFSSRAIAAELDEVVDDTPDMSVDRRAWLQSEVATLRRLLAELHPSRVLERLGFESRLSEAEGELKAQESEWIYEDLKAMGR